MRSAGKRIIKPDHSDKRRHAGLLLSAVNRAIDRTCARQVDQANLGWPPHGDHETFRDQRLSPAITRGRWP